MPLLPTAFLPHLPRTQHTLRPLALPDIVAHIAVLKELYLPPVHGGLQASDTFYDDDDDGTDDNVRHDEAPPDSPAARKRRFSLGLADNMNALGLGMDGPPGDAPSVQLVRQAIAELDEETPGGSADRTPMPPASPIAAPAQGDGLEPAFVLDDAESDDSEEDDEDDVAHLDPFERSWAQKWLEGVVRRAQTWIETIEEESEDKEQDVVEVEGVLRDATAVLALMAGTSAAGSLTRHLLFPIAPTLVPGLSALLPPPLSTGRAPVPISATSTDSNPLYSPQTRTFLASLSRSRTTRERSDTLASTSTLSSSPTDSIESTTHGSTGRGAKRRRRSRPPAIPILLHDAPMSDHLSVGVQTWGSAILLGRELALRPDEFGLFAAPAGDGGVRVLELGAGTGLLSILSRKILDLRAAARGAASAAGEGRDVVLATDFLPSVLDNLKLCVDLNFPPTAAAPAADGGVQIAKLDWTTFPAFAERVLGAGRTGQADAKNEEEMAPYVSRPFDLVLASDCVYDPTHAGMIRQVAMWVLRLPTERSGGDKGGTMHILSPLRPTFAPELQSIDEHFPTHASYPPLAARADGADGGGEGLGRARGLRIGTRGVGKRSVKGKKGEGRVDESGGYWWWEVGWG